MRPDHPLTLTVEQAGRLLGIGRSTAYELVRSGDIECLRLRRRLVVPTKWVAERLGMTLPDLLSALEARPSADRRSSKSWGSVRSSARSESEPPSLF
jgi:excisionase family DNA binding protein